MRSIVAIGAGVTAALVFAVPSFAEPVPGVSSPPAWVVAPSAEKTAAKPDAPLQFLYTSSQERIDKNGLENYVEYGAMPLTTAGLQALGNIVLPWNVERTDLNIHKVSIRRGDKIIDVLKPSEIMVLRRENNLEKATLDGIRTVVIPARGLEVGDVLSVAVSYKSKPYIVGTKPEELQPIVAPFPIARLERRFLIADDIQVRWKLSPTISPAKITKLDGMTEHLFVASDLKPLAETKYAPARFKLPLIQVSGYASWGEVADQLTPLFETARKLEPSSSLEVEADRIAAEAKDPAARMLAALKLAQERVRYVALLLDEGAYVPSTADETWERKFGDCKGKTALLLALLDRLGIEAEAMLISTSLDDRLGDQLPSLYLFDHVIVRADLGGKSYFLDATNYGQRTAEELATAPHLHGLPLRPGSELEALPQLMPSAPLREAKLVWDASNGVENDIPFEATLTLRGSVAAQMRAKLAAAMKMDEFDKSLKDMVPAVSNDSLVIAEKLSESPDGSFVVRFTGKEAMDWSPFDGEKASRYQFSHATVRWEPEFDRDDGTSKDWPVALDAPFWERTVETVILPDGGKGYKLEAAAIDKIVAGSAIRRSVSIDGNRATMISDFKIEKREISAGEARDAKQVLDKTNDDLAYVVGPRFKKRRPSER